MSIHMMTLAAVIAATFAINANANEAAELPGMAAQTANYFFTGKPHDADLGAYVFKFRNYDSAMNRWTTADPSGFPDGANGWLYTGSPHSSVDPNGLRLIYASPPPGSMYYEVGFGTVRDILFWNAGLLAAGPLQAAAMGHAENGTDWNLSSGEIDLVKETSAYTTFKGDVQTAADVYFTSLNDGTYQFNTGPQNYTFEHGSDAYYGFGDARLSSAGSGVVDHSGGIGTETWSYYATVTLSDYFTFYGAPWYTPTEVANRLQSHGWLFPFSTSGSWDEVWSE